MSKNMEGKNIPNANQQNNRMLDSFASHFATADFDESKHPRDKDGKFGVSNGPGMSKVVNNKTGEEVARYTWHDPSHAKMSENSARKHADSLNRSTPDHIGKPGGVKSMKPVDSGDVAIQNFGRKEVSETTKLGTTKDGSDLYVSHQGDVYEDDRGNQRAAFDSSIIKVPAGTKADDIFNNPEHEVAQMSYDGQPSSKSYEKFFDRLAVRANKYI